MNELYTFDPMYQRLLGMDINGLDMGGMKVRGLKKCRADGEPPRPVGQGGDCDGRLPRGADVEQKVVDFQPG